MQSKIIHNNANPEWKQELKIGVKVNSIFLTNFDSISCFYSICIFLSFHQCVKKLQFQSKTGKIFIFIKENICLFFKFKA